MLDNGLKVRVKKRVRDVSDDTDKPDSKIVKNNEIRPLPSNVIPRASQTAGLGIAAAAPPLMNNDQAASSAPWTLPRVTRRYVSNSESHESNWTVWTSVEVDREKVYT